MRKMCLDMVYQLAKTDPRIVFIGSDLAGGTLDRFKREMPDRYFMEGISEANIVGMAAGLALEGKIVYVNTIATFLTRRCFEQVALDLCLHNVKVRLIGNGGGLVYAPLGPTHEAIEDIAILRALPRMTILAPADSEEMKRLMPLTVDHPGPVYIRVAKGGDPVVTRSDLPVRIGKASLVLHGRDAVVITTGITLRLALDAAAALSSQGIKIEVLHLSTIKPLDKDAILDCCGRIPVIVTVEEHSIIGGLGSAVAEVVAEDGWDRPRRLRRLGIPDVFPDRYGSQASLMDYYGITTDSVVNAVNELLDASKCVKMPVRTPRLK